MVAHAGAAARIYDRRTGFSEQLDIAFGQGFEENLAGGGNDHHPAGGMNPFTLQGPGDNLKVLDAGVGAGAEKDLIDFGALDCGDRFDIVHTVRAGDKGFEIADIEFVDAFEIGVRVGGDDGERRARTPLEEGQGFVIRFHIAVLGAEFNGHIGQHHAA